MNNTKSSVPTTVAILAVLLTCVAWPVAVMHDNAKTNTRSTYDPFSAENVIQESWRQDGFNLSDKEAAAYVRELQRIDSLSTSTTMDQFYRNRQLWQLERRYRSQ